MSAPSQKQAFCTCWSSWNVKQSSGVCDLNNMVIMVTGSNLAILIIVSTQNHKTTRKAPKITSLNDFSKIAEILRSTLKKSLLIKGSTGLRSLWATFWPFALATLALVANLWDLWHLWHLCHSTDGHCHHPILWNHWLHGWDVRVQHPRCWSATQTRPWMTSWGSSESTRALPHVVFFVSKLETSTDWQDLILRVQQNHIQFSYYINYMIGPKTSQNRLKECDVKFPNLTILVIYQHFGAWKWLWSEILNRSCSGGYTNVYDSDLNYVAQTWLQHGTQ